MHYGAAAGFVMAMIMSGFLFWMVALIAWPLPGRKQGCVAIACAVLLAAAGCWILAGAAGGLWYAGLCTAPILFAVAAKITPAGRHHRR